MTNKAVQALIPLVLIGGSHPEDGVYQARASGNVVNLYDGSAVFSSGDTYVKGIDVKCAVIVSGSLLLLDFANKNTKPEPLCIQARLLPPELPVGKYKAIARFRQVMLAREVEQRESVDLDFPIVLELLEDSLPSPTECEVEVTKDGRYLVRLA